MAKKSSYYVKPKIQYGKTAYLEGRKIEIVSEYQEWTELAAKVLNEWDSKVWRKTHESI